MSALDVGSIYDELDELFALFKDQFKQSTGVEIEMDRAALINVAQSFVFDLDRYSVFHELDLPDRARRSAYLCKWIMRLRPVQVRVDVLSLSEDRATFCLMANELYAVAVASMVMHIDLEQHLSGRIMNILLYSLRYRSSSEDAFILFFGQLCHLK